MMTDKFLEATNKKMLTLMVLLDLYKAFDSIDHAQLLVKLSSFGVASSGAICMIASSICDLSRDNVPNASRSNAERNDKRTGDERLGKPFETGSVNG